MIRIKDAFLINLAVKALRHPKKAVVWSLLRLPHYLHLYLKNSEVAKASHFGERLVIKDWDSARKSSDPTILGHLARYEWVLPMLKKTQAARILDDGCGSGYGTYWLATHGFGSIIGVDISPDAIRFAQRHYQAENLLFMVMDSCELQFDSESFDVVVTFDVLEHIPFKFKERFISESARVLKPSGTLYIGCPNGALAIVVNPFHFELGKNEFESYLSEYYKDVSIFGQDIIINRERQKSDWHNAIQRISLTMENFAIVKEDCELAFGLLAICRKT